MSTHQVSKVYSALTNWHNFRLKLFAEGILVGVLAGCVVSLFRYLLEESDGLREQGYQFMSEGSWGWTVLFFFCLLGISYVLYWLGRWEPMISGSGIPQVKGVILGQFRMRWLQTLIGKFLGGVLAIGSGLSLGREGPSIQLGASIGQGVSRLLGRTRMEERYLMTSGASAGLAAAFNAPLAAVIFSLEELHKNFSPAVFLSAVAAALTADVISRHFYGESPLFAIQGLSMLPLQYYWLILLLGILMGVLGVVFNKALLGALNLFDRQRLLTGPGKAAFALLLTGAVGFFLPQVLGGGNQLVNELAVPSYGLYYLLLLLVVKFLLTMLGYGSGVPGGIFLPLLVVGALGGTIFGQAAVLGGWLDAQYAGSLMILAMAGYFSAIVRAPITGSILIMEMTGSFHHLLTLIIVSMVAYITAELLKGQPIYEELLNRSLGQKGKTPPQIISQKQMLLEVVVCLGSELDGKLVRNVPWPSPCLLVNIKRGEEELMARGDTRLLAGDYLYFLTDSVRSETLRRLAEG